MQGQTLEQAVAKARETGTLVLVEGKKDKAALEQLGFSNVMHLQRRALYQVVEDVAEGTDECILLMDLDKKGKELFGKLSRDLQRFGVRIDTTLRDFLYRYTPVRQIEGLPSYLAMLQKAGQ